MDRRIDLRRRYLILGLLAIPVIALVAVAFAFGFGHSTIDAPTVEAEGAGTMSVQVETGSKSCIDPSDTADFCVQAGNAFDISISVLTYPAEGFIGLNGWLEFDQTKLTFKKPAGFPTTGAGTDSSGVVIQDPPLASTPLGGQVAGRVNSGGLTTGALTPNTTFVGVAFIFPFNCTGATTDSLSTVNMVGLSVANSSATGIAVAGGKQISVSGSITIHCQVPPPPPPGGAPDLTITKTASSTSVASGVPLTYTIKVRNEFGSAGAAFVRMIDTPPSTFTITGFSTTRGNCVMVGAALGGKLDCDLGSFVTGPAAVATITITGSYTVAADEVLFNSAEVDPKGIIVELDDDNNTAEVRTIVLALTPTPTPTDTPTVTQTPTSTATPTITNTPTITATSAATSTPTVTPPPANTATPTNTLTVIATPTSTARPTSTATPTNTPFSVVSPTIVGPTPTPLFATATPSGALLGDVDCNGVVDSRDALWVLWLVAQLTAELPCPNVADVNGDGMVGVTDALQIMWIEAGLI